MKASEYDSIELKNSCTQLDNYQAEQLYMVALKNIMQRFGTDYKFENSLFRIVCFLTQQYKYTFHKSRMQYKNTTLKM